MGELEAENIKLIKHYLWDTLEIDWKEVTVTFNYIPRKWRIYPCINIPREREKNRMPVCSLRVKLLNEH